MWDCRAWWDLERGSPATPENPAGAKDLFADSQVESIRGRRKRLEALVSSPNGYASLERKH